jgi:hypothetical protein
LVSLSNAGKDNPTENLIYLYIDNTHVLTFNSSPVIGYAWSRRLQDPITHKTILHLPRFSFSTEDLFFGFYIDFNDNDEIGIYFRVNEKFAKRFNNDENNQRLRNWDTAYCFISINELVENPGKEISNLKLVSNLDDSGRIEELTERVRIIMDPRTEMYKDIINHIEYIVRIGFPEYVLKSHRSQESRRIESVEAASNNSLVL